MGAGRRRELDGLRGVAALVVVVHHLALLDPALASAVLGQDVAVGWRAVITYSPLHVVWAGTEAVSVFFVLSGYVLVRPYLHGRRMEPACYLRQRSLRLYLPVVVAVLLAISLRGAASLLPGWGSETGPWFAKFWHVTDLQGVLRDVSLLWTDASAMGVLWSLRWEVVFSALLPLILGLAKRPVAALAAATVAVVAVPDVAVMMVPFLLGAGVARAEGRLGGVRPGWGWLALLLLTAHWVMAPHAGVPSVTAPLTVFGAVLLLVAVLNGFGGTVLTSAGAEWVGARSYSLYLVHEPLLIFVGVALISTSPLIGGLVVPLSLVAAHVMHRAVEQPSSRLRQRAPHLDFAEHQVVGRT